jgi:hypothetical protein
MRFSAAELEIACREVLGYVDINVILDADQTAPTATEAIRYSLGEAEPPSPEASLHLALQRLEPLEREVVEATYGIGRPEPISVKEAYLRWGKQTIPLLRSGISHLRGVLPSSRV